MTTPQIRGPLTAEIGNPRSPVREFLNERFTVGLRDVQRRYRESAPSEVVPTVPRSEANPGTVGTAADWLLRFLVHPSPAPDLAMAGVALGQSFGVNMAPAFMQIATYLGLQIPRAPGEVQVFTGPIPGSPVQAELLARSCWALALLSEVYRGGPPVIMEGPLAQYRGRKVAGEELLALCPPAGLDQLAQFRKVFETTLIPRLATNHGLWALGPTFAGSALINADADLIAGGLLLELKTTSKLSLAVTDLFQVIGYALLDFEDEYHIDELGMLAARYGYLAVWEIADVLDQLTGHNVVLRTVRDEFRRLLESGTERTLN